MGIETRSMTSLRDAEERRRFLEEGAAAAHATRAGQLRREHETNATVATTAAPIIEHRAQQVAAERQSVALQAEGGSRERESTRSRSVDDVSLWRARQQPVPIPLEPIAVIANEPQSRPSQVTFARTRGAPSLRSRASSTTEARRKAAELEASERLADLKRQELQLEAELVKKRLDAMLSQIDAEGSVRDDASNQDVDRIEQWIDNSQSGEATPFRTRKADEEPSDFETLKRTTNPNTNLNPNFESTNRMRQRSMIEDRCRPESPQADTYTSRTARTQHTNEATIAESMVQLFERMQTAARPAPRDIFELPAFYGNVSEWRSFHNVYTETAKRYNFSDYENVARLRTALRGDARACVQHVLSTATRPELILRILKKQYGRSEVLLDRAIEDLRRLPPLGSTAHDLNNFAIKVMNVVSTVIDLDKKHYADNPLLIREITDRLSPHLRSRWCEYARLHEHSEDSEILQLADFLMRESEQELRFCHSRAPLRRPTGTGPSTATREAPARTTDTKHVGYGPRAENHAPSKGRIPEPRFSYATKEAAARTSCLYCGGGHRTTDCRKLAAETLGARWDWAKMNGICFKCLDAKHRRDRCKAKGCSVVECPHPHHRLLHGESTEPQSAATAAPTPLPRTSETPRPAARTRPSQELNAPRDTNARAYTSISSQDVLLKVLPVTITGPSGTAHVCAMLDDGSTLSLLEEDIAEQIGASGPESPLNVRGIGNIAHRAYTQTVKATVRPVHGGAAHDVTFRTVSGLGLRSQTLDKQRLTSYEHLRDLGDECYTTGIPQMLIGADHWHLLVPTEIRMGRKNEPAAMKGPLGWVFFGTVPRVIKTNEVVMHCRTEPSDDLDEIMKKHWAIESLGVTTKENIKPADERAMKIFDTTAKKIGDRYEVGQLWTSDDTKLPPSYSMAYSRLRNLENRMDRDKDFADDYTKQIHNLLENGYAERVYDVPTSNVAWFLPHFSVFNNNKGKGRAVFDCAAKSQGHALNDYVLQGPDLLQNLLGILLRFRERSFAITADIQEMFLRIQIRKEDQPSQLFLWRGAQRDCAPRVYKLNRVCFGCVSSPFLAHAVRNRNAEENQEKYPEAVYDIKKNHYMDDYVASYETEDDLLRVAKQVHESHAEAGFKLRSYASNSEKLLATIDPELHASEPTTFGEKEQKVLGMFWSPATDTLSYNTRMLRVSDDVKQLRRTPTKRELLSVIMSIYDPLGLIANFVISAKIIYQRVWNKCATWDTPLPAQEAEDFFQWMDALKYITELKIPRQYEMTGLRPTYTLHIFTDASTEAYCAVAYWRTQDEDSGNVRVSLAAGKSRVCPIKVMTVPRLELSAAVMGLRLAQTILKEQRYPVSGVTYWTDSKTVLCWIRDDARQYNPFVSFRISEITETSDRKAWRWVPTKMNPADAGTRCRPSQKITANHEWFQGPAFLRQPEQAWPENVLERGNEADLPERKTTKITATTMAVYAERDPAAGLPELGRFSSYNRLINATANVLLFVEKLKTKNKTLQLSVKHLKQAEHMWLQNSQWRCFAEEFRALSRGKEIEKKSRIFNLAPELCNDGVLRMKTRLNNAPVQYTTPSPIILDGRDILTKLLIAREHKRSAHVHNEAVINILRQEYWILNLRSTVKTVARSCQLCRVRRANPRAQPLGDLPAERLQPFQRPFTYCAQDYMGPLCVTIGRRREKRWVCLYTCLTSRAVHLEVVHTLSTDSAIMALRRFAARRGWPRVMWSDNATCFKGAAAELREAFTQWLPHLRDYATQHHMEWKFIPPGNPSAGGAWERMIRTVKTAMGYAINSRVPKEEVLLTILAEIENIVNQRPLTHVSMDPSSSESLTPSHFLLLSTTNLPMFEMSDLDDRKQWRAAQALANYFWRRWVREYLPLLAPRQSSDGGGRQVQTGDVVIIADPNGPRSVWPKGLVVATHPGPDGRVRSADVKTKHGTLRRPTCKLAVIASCNDPCNTVSGATGGQNVDDAT